MTANPSENTRQLLRHTLATLAYRGGKAVQNAPPEFAEIRVGESTRTPIQILAHINDLLDWGCWLAQGQHKWESSTPQSWEREVERFFAGLERLDLQLRTDTELGCPEERLFQGPIADALTHVGQIAMLRRLAGAPVRGENYFKADIEVGRLGPQQSTKRVEFD
jgi:hypothetical protein